ncbi:MAG: hypothetical protein Q8S84_06175 [bacterium]|nr:hypothetical protein [bacterium]
MLSTIDHVKLNTSLGHKISEYVIVSRILYQFTLIASVTLSHVKSIQIYLSHCGLLYTFNFNQLISKESPLINFSDRWKLISLKLGNIVAQDNIFCDQLQVIFKNDKSSLNLILASSGNTNLNDLLSDI